MVSVLETLLTLALVPHVQSQPCERVTVSGHGEFQMHQTSHLHLLQLLVRVPVVFGETRTVEKESRQPCRRNSRFFGARLSLSELKALREKNSTEPRWKIGVKLFL